MEWQEVEVDVDKIDVGIPEYQWLLNQLDDEQIAKRFQELYNEPLPDKKELLKWMHIQYTLFLKLPLLVREYTIEGEKRYQLLDGHQRFVVLVMGKGFKKVKAQIWQQEMLNQDWTNRLSDLILKQIDVPQKHYLHGESPWNLWLENDPMYNGQKKRVYSFMIATGVKVPYILKNWETLGRVEARGDEFKKEWSPIMEFLVGEGDHELIANHWGSQPLNSYLVGHFCCEEPAKGNALAQRHGNFVQIQQYFRAGYWGYDCPNWAFNRESTVREQLIQNLVGIPQLFKLGILNLDTPMYFADQSFHGNFPIEEAQLFKGLNGLREYHKWLPVYFRNYRANDFKIPIEEVIECIPKRTPT